MRGWFRDALRAVARAKGSSLVVVLTLGLGLGATTAIFSVVRGVLLSPLPFPAPERVLMLWQRAPGVGVSEDWFSPAQYFDIREGVGSFEETAIVSGSNVTLTGDDVEPERVGALAVSASFFELFGIGATSGRILTPEDDLPGASVKALVAPALLERRFGNDPSIVGRSIRVDGEPVEVVGILPSLPLDSDLVPTLATVPVFDLVLSLPLEDPGRTTYGSENYNVVARIAEGASLAEVEGELALVAEALVRDPQSLGAGLAPGTEYRIATVALLDQIVGEVRPVLVVLQLATALLLLIACANVGNLLIGSATLDRRDVAVRVALGAPRSEIVATSLLRSALLAACGTLVGLAVAAIAVRALASTAAIELPRMAEVAVAPGVVLFAALAGLGSCLLFGLAPAWRSSRTAPAAALSDASNAARARSFFRGGTRYLVVLQVALSLALTSAAVLVLRTYRLVASVDPGFRVENVLTFRLSLVGERYDEPQARAQFFRLLLDEIRDAPGVEAAGGVSILPLTRGYAWTDFDVEGQEPADDRDRMVADVFVVTPGYFEAMGVPVLAGRTLTDAEGDALVVMVNRAFAERFWPVPDAVDRWVGRATRDERARIVGVVGDVKQYGLDREGRPAVFYSHAMLGSRTLYGVLRSSSAPATVAGHVREAVRALDPEVPVYAVRAMSDRLSDSLARRALTTKLLLLFGSFAVAISSVGLYGVLAFSVASGSRELGIRKALGASSGDLYRLVLRGASLMTLAGLGLGFLFSRTMASYLDGLLYGIGSADPLSWAAAVAAVIGVCGIASLVPARRASRVDPAVVLRDE